MRTGHSSQPRGGSSVTWTVLVRVVVAGLEQETVRTNGRRESGDRVDVDIS